MRFFTPDRYLIPTPEEAAQQAQQQQAEQVQQQAEQAQQQAEQERQWADRLAQQLRDLGITPTDDE